MISLLSMGGRRATGVGDESGPAVGFLGGMRSLGLNATWPLARLMLFGEGFRIERSARWLPVPSWEARYDELTEVQAVGKIRWWNTGIRFRVHDAGWVVFWTLDRPAVMQAFVSHGVPANAEPIRFNVLNPGR